MIDTSLNTAPERRIREDERLPIIDVGPYLAGTPGAEQELATALRKACEDIGFFFITNHGIDETLIAECFDQSKRFFDLPMDVKKQNLMNESQSGYQPLKASVYRDNLSRNNRRGSISEAYKYTFDLAEGDPDFGSGRRFRDQPNWPSKLPGFREFSQRYIRAFDDVAYRLLAPLAISLGLPAKIFESSFDRSTSAVRLAHYPQVSPDERDGYMGSPPHQDLSFLTLIPPTEVPGLDVLLPGGDWLEVPRVHGAVLVNTGLALQRWTDGHYRATPHRVRIPQDQGRYSNIFFYYPNLEARIAPPDGFKSAHPTNASKPITFEAMHVEYCDRNFQYVNKLSNVKAEDAV